MLKKTRLAKHLTAEYTQSVPGSGDAGYELRDGNDPLISTTVTRLGSCSANQENECGDAVTCS